MKTTRMYLAIAFVAGLSLTGCPFDNQEDVGESDVDATVGEGGEGEGEIDATVGGEGEGEGGEGEGEGGEGEGEGGEGEGEGGEGEGEGEGDCEPGAARECQGDCMAPGEQRCGEDGRWNRCSGEVLCDRAACAEAHPDVCGEGPACRGDQRQECDAGACFAGFRACVEGEWSECQRGAARCERAECARELPDLCGMPADCDAGAARECERPCFFGEQVCVEGRWSECSRDEPRCDVEACVRELGELCEAPAECDAGAARACDTPCFFGEQRCVEGRWSECSREVPRCEVEACVRELPDLCAPAECDLGAERRCEADCFVGEQACGERGWGECVPVEVRCANAECAARFPDRCAEPAECEPGAEQRCESDCVIGSQICVEGAWSECRPREVRCALEVCAREFPEQCGPAPVCEAGAFQECERPCFRGRQACVDGAWGECSRGTPRCDVEACVRELGELCDAPAACEPGAEQRCENDCVIGSQACVEGAWSECRPREVRCALEACAREFPDLCR